jgi:hypothetical protein
MMDDTRCGKLYSINQAVLAALVGGPLGGAILLAQNYRRLRAPNYAHLALVFGLMATAALVPVAFSLPERVPQFALPVAYAVAFRLLMGWLQGEQIRTRIAAGVMRHSWWRVAGLTLLAVICTALIFTAGAWAMMPLLIS